MSLGISIYAPQGLSMCHIRNETHLTTLKLFSNQKIAELGRIHRTSLCGNTDTLLLPWLLQAQSIELTQY